MADLIVSPVRIHENISYFFLFSCMNEIYLEITCDEFVYTSAQWLHC